MRTPHSVAVLIVTLATACASSSDSTKHADASSDGGDALVDEASVDGAPGGDAKPSVSVMCDNADPAFCTCIGVDPAQATPDKQCTPSMYQPDALCCASADYPAKGSQCQCQEWGCNDTGNNCFCGNSPAPGATTSCVNAYSHCCMSDTGTCSCSNFACPSYKTEVATCGLANTKCIASKLRIDRCTL